MEFFLIAFPGPDIQHGSCPTAEPGREGPPVEIGAPHGIGRKNAEQPCPVGHVVDRDAVHQHEIVARAAAAYMDAFQSVRSGLDTGQEMNGPDQVRLPAQGRHVFNDGYRYGESSVRPGIKMVEGVFGYHHHFLQSQRTAELKVQPDIPVQFNRPDQRVVTEIGKR